jgi:hypothetical protein
MGTDTLCRSLDNVVKNKGRRRCNFGSYCGLFGRMSDRWAELVGSTSGRNRFSLKS